jgi:Yip1-like protein
MSAHHDSSTGLSPSAPRSSAAPVVLIRIWGMLFAPKEEWELIQREGNAPLWIYGSFVLPLAILAACVAFLHVSVLGTTEAFGGTVRASLRGGLTTAALVLVCGLLGIWIIAFLVDAFATFFGALRNRRLGAAAAAYSSTPIWIAMMLVPFPNVWAFAYLLALGWHTYLLYLGLRVLLKTPRDRVLGFATTVVLCSILLEIIFTMVSVGLGGATHMNPYRAFG